MIAYGNSYLRPHRLSKVMTSPINNSLPVSTDITDISVINKIDNNNNNNNEMWKDIDTTLDTTLHTTDSSQDIINQSGNESLHIDSDPSEKDITHLRECRGLYDDDSDSEIPTECLEWWGVRVDPHLIEEIEARRARKRLVYEPEPSSKELAVEVYSHAKEHTHLHIHPNEGSDSFHPIDYSHHHTNIGPQAELSGPSLDWNGPQSEPIRDKRTPSNPTWSETVPKTSYGQPGHPKVDPKLFRAPDQAPNYDWAGSRESQTEWDDNWEREREREGVVQRAVPAGRGERGPNVRARPESTFRPPFVSGSSLGEWTDGRDREVMVGGRGRGRGVWSERERAKGSDGRGERERYSTHDHPSIPPYSNGPEYSRIPIREPVRESRGGPKMSGRGSEYHPTARPEAPSLTPYSNPSSPPTSLSLSHSSAEPSQCTVSFYIPDISVSGIIGKQGTVISDLRRKHHVGIYIDKDDMRVLSDHVNERERERERERASGKSEGLRSRHKGQGNSCEDLDDIETDDV